jgi:hypothetical protein
MKKSMIGVLALAAFVSLGFAARAFTAEPATRPGVAGEWKGTWELYSPPLPGAPKRPNPPPMGLDAKVVEKPGGKWEATFEGDCGRPYKYTIKMGGRQAGNVVLFQGTADLGEADGGVFDWIGRATEKEFVGFYTSTGYTGTFRLARPKVEASK